MADRTRASVVDGMCHHGNGKYRAGRLRYYFKGDELKDFRKAIAQSNAYMHVMDIRADAEDYDEQYEAAVTECWLKLCCYDAIAAGNEYKANCGNMYSRQLIRHLCSEVRACKSAAPSPLADVRLQLAKGVQAHAPVNLIKGENAYYKDYSTNPLGRDVAEDVLMTTENFLTVLSERFDGETTRSQKLFMAIYCKLYDQPIPNKAGYPETFAAIKTLIAAHTAMNCVWYDAAFSLGWIDYDYEPGEMPLPKAETVAQQEAVWEKFANAKAAGTEFAALKLKFANA